MQENNNNSEGKEIEFDVLTEIGNIGAGNATTALSQLINARIDMRVPKVDLLGFSELAEIVGGAETLVAGILLSLEGDVDGMMLFVLESSAAHLLVDQLRDGTVGSDGNRQHYCRSIFIINFRINKYENNIFGSLSCSGYGRGNP